MTTLPPPSRMTEWYSLETGSRHHPSSTRQHSLTATIRRAGLPGRRRWVGLPSESRRTSTGRGKPSGRRRLPESVMRDRMP